MGTRRKYLPVFVYTGDNRFIYTQSRLTLHALPDGLLGFFVEDVHVVHIEDHRHLFADLVMGARVDRAT